METTKYKEWSKNNNVDYKSVDNLLAYSNNLSKSLCPTTVNSYISKIKNYLLKEEKIEFEMKSVYDFINTKKDEYKVKKANVLSEEDILKIMDKLPNSNLDLMKKIFLMFGLFGSIRISQLDCICFNNVLEKPDGIMVTTEIKKKKQKKGNIRKGVEKEFFIPKSNIPSRNIIELVKIYKEELQKRKIPLSGKFWKQWMKLKDKSYNWVNQPMGKHKLETISKEVALLIGKKDWWNFTSHSMKVILF
jgi:integrase